MTAMMVITNCWAFNNLQQTDRPQQYLAAIVIAESKIHSKDTGEKALSFHGNKTFFILHVEYREQLPF